MFHQIFGYYAQEVGPNTAILRNGWENLLFPVVVKPGFFTSWMNFSADIVGCGRARKRCYRSSEVVLDRNFMQGSGVVYRLEYKYEMKFFQCTGEIFGINAMGAAKQ